MYTGTPACKTDTLTHVSVRRRTHRYARVRRRTHAYTNAGIEIKSILAKDCVPLRSGLAVLRSSVHIVTQLRYIPQRNAMQELASYCEPALRWAYSPLRTRRQAYFGVNKISHAKRTPTHWYARIHMGTQAYMPVRARTHRYAPVRRRTET